jgi:hypothetical protein
MHRNALLRILADVEQRLALCEAKIADRHARLAHFLRACARAAYWSKN